VSEERAELRKDRELQKIDPEINNKKFGKAFASLGFGINYYFVMLIRLIIFFLIASGLSLITMSAFNYPQYSSTHSTHKSGYLNLFAYSLGNLGIFYRK